MKTIKNMDDKEVVSILRRYSAGEIGRIEAMESLGIDWYG